MGPTVWGGVHRLAVDNTGWNAFHRAVEPPVILLA